MDILDNPFFVLGATTRDDRRRIMGLAEEKSLLSKEEVAAEASSALTNPRKRLAAEVGWFPGMSPSRVSELLKLLDKDPKALLGLVIVNSKRAAKFALSPSEEMERRINLRSVSAARLKQLEERGAKITRENVEALSESLQKEINAHQAWKNERERMGVLPPLSQANIIASGLTHIQSKLYKEDVSFIVLELASAFERIDFEKTLILINEDRAASGFPEFRDGHALETELDKRRQHYRTVIKKALNHLSSADLVNVITEAVETATDGGESHAPVLIDDLVDIFEVEAQGFFEKETRNIAALIEQIRAAAAQEQDEAVLTQLVSKLERLVRNWDLVAQPIQVSARSRGLDHALSHELAGELRGLAVELFNEHDHLKISQHMTTLIQEVFAEVDRVVERTEEDAAVLDKIAEQRTELLNNAKAEAEQWRREITYEAEWGLVFKDRLKISPDGVEWKGRLIPLDSISRLRWGGTKHYVNGVPSGTTYSIFVGADWEVEKIELREEQVYGEFIERLWKAVGIRLLTQLLEGLKKGEKYRFGNAVIDDYGAEIERPHMFGPNEKVRCRWSDLVIGNANGGFYIAKKDEMKVAANLPYQDEDNVHILEAAMRTFWKRSSARISDLLKSDR